MMKLSASGLNQRSLADRTRLPSGLDVWAKRTCHKDRLVIRSWKTAVQLAMESSGTLSWTALSFTSSATRWVVVVAGTFVARWYL